MVQYLYAAYSLGGPQVPEVYRDRVRNWQEVILGVAKEEMGHLICVQNSLRLIGAPLHLEREDMPWDLPFYPFPFMLEPLTLDSLAKYVYAEAPQPWDGGALKDEIWARVNAKVGTAHHVAELFKRLIPLVEDPDYLPDSTFDAATSLAQADFAEWGRGYHGGNRGNSGGGAPRQTSDVLVVPQTCRDDMVAALRAVAEQGEATSGASRSHFVRFLTVYTEMRATIDNNPVTCEQWHAARPASFSAAHWAELQPAATAPLTHADAGHGGHGWAPARAVAVNPYVSTLNRRPHTACRRPHTACRRPTSRRRNRRCGRPCTTCATACC